MAYEAVVLARDAHQPLTLALAVEAAAAAAVASGDGALAARRLGWAASRRAEFGLPLVAGERVDVDLVEVEARRLVSNDAVVAALAAGAASDLKDLLPV